MRRLLPVPFLMVCCVLAVLVTNAGAVGLGAYIERGSGSAEWEEDRAVGGTFEFDTDDTITGFGFVLDTNVARDRVFNYRLQVGYEKLEAEFKNSGGIIEFKGISLTNDFGFGVLRTPHVRLWLGPELKLAYLTGSPEGNNDYDISHFKFGIGPVIGANFNIGSTLTLAVKTGYLFQGFAGFGESDRRDDEDDFTGTSTNFFVNFAIIFRIGDIF